METETSSAGQYLLFEISNPQISEEQLCVVPLDGWVQSFATYSVNRPGLGKVFCSLDAMIYPLQFSFITPVFNSIPFLFLVQFLI